VADTGGTVADTGGGPARRAMVRWAWRLFRRERDLLIIVIGTPLIAAAIGWLVAGREPAGIAQQPLE